MGNNPSAPSKEQQQQRDAASPTSSTSSHTHSNRTSGSHRSRPTTSRAGTIRSRDASSRQDSLQQTTQNQAGPPAPAETGSSASDTAGSSSGRTPSSSANSAAGSAPGSRPTTQLERYPWHHSNSGSVSDPFDFRKGDGWEGAGMGIASSSEKLPRRAEPQHSGAVAVPPGRSRSQRTRQQAEEAVAGGPPRERPSAYGAHTNLNFPPRLPLPIQAEEYTPGSPVLTPADFEDREEEEDGEGADGLAGPSKSLLSHTTVDGEEEAGEEYGEEGVEGKGGMKVSTELEWRGMGDKVYVTGTFTGWSKKYRMHRDPATGTMKLALELLPGNHHVRFIVDGQMILSEDLPTAVDYTNTLVNYLEISAEALPLMAHTPEAPPPAKDAATTGPISTSDAHAQPPSIQPPPAMPHGVSAHDHDPNARNTIPGDAGTGTQRIDVPPSTDPAVGQHSRRPSRTTPESSHGEASAPALLERSAAHYGQLVPGYLPDLDRPEKSARFARASRRAGEIPAPPSLPLFLGKSILNGTTPMKDDASVLNVPNHTVLNHLATSSIRNEVLATSLTVRYRRKYTTLITYRPTSTDD